MASFLYECLREVGLQRYYARFGSLGLRHPAQLSKLTMSDYPRLGVHPMEDRTRLFYLVQVMKALHEGQEDECEHRGDDDDEERGTMADFPAAPRRRLYFGPPSPEPRLEVLAKGGKANAPVDKGYAMRSAAQRDDELGSCRTPVVASNQRRKACASTGPPKSLPRAAPATTGCHIYKDSETPRNRKTKKQVGRLKEMRRKVLMHQQSTPVYRVKCGQGYNYGLPNSSPVSSTRVVRCGGAGFERIRVCVRKRPLSCSEERRGEADVVAAQDRDCVLISEKKEAVDLSQYVLQHEFYYDEVFSETCTNEDVYLKTARPLIQHIFTGGKATCFAYGQTGAGKTYTMLGSPQRPGLYALAGRDIFAHLGKSLSEPSVTRLPEAPLVFVSFFEIYCGQLYDLLDHRKRLFAREDQHHVVQIVGLREVMVDSVDNLLQVISCGSRERRQGASGVNCDSSRSHALLQIHLRDSKRNLIGRISFVDLAGSERAVDTRQPDRQNRIEGAEINQSLLALKECIRALDQEHMHPPFRQSKLTQVLKDSFIGNSKTCMIANISPSHLATEHTLNTLRYADRVKELKKGKTSLLSPPRASSKYSNGPSPKLSKNNSGKSPLKKVRSGGCTTGADDCVPTSSPLRIEFPFADVLLCSTPKFATEEKSQKRQGEDFLAHLTPVRGTLRNGMSRHSKEWEKGLVAKETNKNLRCYHRASAKNPEQAAKQSGEHGIQESICWKKLQERLLLEEEFAGQRDVHDIIIKTSKDKLVDKREKTQDQERWGEHQKVREREETEAVEHLRRYHQQLQKLPFPPASLLGSLAEQTLPGLVGMNECAVQSPAVNLGTVIYTPPEITPVVWVGEDKNPSNNLCKDCLETDEVWCSRSSRQTVMTAWDTKDGLSRGVISEKIPSRGEETAEVTGSTQESLSSYQLDFSRYAGRPEMLDQNGLFESSWTMLRRRMERLDVHKQESGGEQVPTICRTADDLMFERLQLPAREEPDSWEGEGEGMVRRNTYGLSEWSTEEERNGTWDTCDLSESSNGSSNVPAEKPFSSFIYKTPLNPEKHGNVFPDHKAISHVVQDGLCTKDLHEVSDIPVYPLLRDNINSHGPSRSCSSDKVQGAGWIKEIPSTASTHQLKTGPLFCSEMFPLGQSSFAVSSEADAQGSPDAQTKEGSQELIGIKGDAYSRMPLNTLLITSHNSMDTSTCSNTTMGPLSISLLDVERQAATDSIFQRDCTPPCNSMKEQKEEGVEESPLSSDTARGVNNSKNAVEFKGQTRHQGSFMDPSLLNGSFLETATQHGRKVHGDPSVSIEVTHKQAHGPTKKVQADLCREMVALEFAQDVDLPKLHAATSRDRFPCVGSSGASESVGKVNDWDSSNAVHNSGVSLEKLVSDSSSRKAVLADQVLKDGHLEEFLHSTRQDLAWVSYAVSSHSENVTSAAELNAALLHRAKLGEAQRFVIQAHCEQLAKMESLCQREEALLSLQPNMDFGDYVLMLKEIMELQSQCVHSMRLQLDLYLTPMAQLSHTA